jgi:hypothetical protein
MATGDTGRESGPCLHLYEATGKCSDRQATGGAGGILTLAELLEDLRNRGLKLLLRPDGTPFLRGDKAEVTSLLLQVLQLRRDEIVAYLQQQGASSVVEGREWFWRDGRRHHEAATDEHFGDRTWHPEGAWWWRFQGASEWHLVKRPEVTA